MLSLTSEITKFLFYTTVNLKNAGHYPDLKFQHLTQNVECCKNHWMVKVYKMIDENRYSLLKTNNHHTFSLYNSKSQNRKHPGKNNKNKKSMFPWLVNEMYLCVPEIFKYFRDLAISRVECKTVVSHLEIWSSYDRFALNPRFVSFQCWRFQSFTIISCHSPCIPDKTK